MNTWMNGLEIASFEDSIPLRARRPLFLLDPLGRVLAHVKNVLVTSAACTPVNGRR
jgi:hypothetical protein